MVSAPVSDDIFMESHAVHEQQEVCKMLSPKSDHGECIKITICVQATGYGIYDLDSVTGDMMAHTRTTQTRDTRLPTLPHQITHQTNQNIRKLTKIKQCHAHNNLLYNSPLILKKKKFKQLPQRLPIINNFCSFFWKV